MGLQDRLICLHQGARVGGFLGPGAGSGNGFQMSGSRCLPPPGYAIVALISVISQMFKTGGGRDKAWAPAAVLLFQDMKTFLQEFPVRRLLLIFTGCTRDHSQLQERIAKKNKVVMIN